MPTLLAEPGLTPVQAIDDGEFIDLGYHPVFKAHRDRDGNVFGDAEIHGLVESNNDRIADTGDYCPIVIRHTKEGQENGQEVVGFLGPYRYGRVGNLNPASAVEGRIRIFKSDADKVRRFPRMSVELWSTKGNPTKGIFDPACLLGSETPELDLGLIRYAKDRSGHIVRRYSRATHFQASAPGGSNTYMPSMGGDCDDGDERRKRESQEQKTNYQASGGMLSDVDLQQILAGLKSMAVEIIDERMAAMNKADPANVQMDQMSADPAMNAADGAAGDPNIAAGDAAAGDAEVLGEDPSALGDDPDADLDGDTDGDLDEDDADSDADAEFAGDDSDFDALDDDGDNGTDDDDDAGNDDDTEVIEDSASGAVSADDAPPNKKKKYAADANAGRSVSLSSDEDLSMADNPTPAADAAEQVKRYQKERDDARSELAKAKKDNDELRTKYQKEVDARRGSETELTALKQRVEKIEVSERRAVRYQKLSEIASRGYVFEVEDEIKDCEPMTAEQFDKHCERIVSRYQRVPIDMLPVPATQRIDSDGKASQERRERYAKKAGEEVLAARQRGEKLDFKVALERITAEGEKEFGKAGSAAA